MCAAVYAVPVTTSLRGQYLKHELAELEAALARFALSRLLGAGFQLVSVPDMLGSSALEACGVAVRGDRTMVSGRGGWRRGFEFV